MSQVVPELQVFSKMFESTFFDMTAERYKLKNELEKLGKAVIKERNEKLGLKRFLTVFNSDSAKYFEYLEEPNAVTLKDKDGNEYQSSGLRTSKAGLSKAQAEFLDFMHELQDLRNEQLEELGKEANEEIFKVDKGVSEAYSTEGIVSAFSSYLGNGFNIRNVRIPYTDPKTKVKEVLPYKEIEAKLIGMDNKVKALGLMAYYNNKAKRQLKEGFNADQTDNENILEQRPAANYSINPNGVLTNKFLKPRSKDRGYSKDYYKAALEFIDDYTHTKHMSPLLPYIDSIEAINETGFGDHANKPNVVKWIKDWKDLHLYKEEKIGALGPEMDSFLRTLRKATSLAVMAFNFPAAGWNLMTGIYNNIKSESLAMQTKGLKRLIPTTGKGYDPKALAIIRQYQAVSSDYDSNPKLFAGKLFDYLANGANRAAEYVIQGSMFLGQMSQEDLNSFDYSKEKGLTIKSGVDEKALKERMIKYKNRVSDIQGKYADKDRRNYMLGEFGKAVSQFKVYMPDFIRERFGEEYITADNKVKRGSFREFYGDAFKELRADIKKNGKSAIWNNKNAMSNLKEAMVFAVLLSMKLSGDDDDKKKMAGKLIDGGLKSVLGIFDPQSLKFSITNPVASVGTLTRFVDALQHGMQLEFGKAGKDIGKAIPYNKAVRQTYDLLTEE